MTPRAELNQMLIVANNTLKHKNNPVMLQLDKNAGGYRIMLRDSRELSPRLSAKNLIIWLDGFIEGLEF